MTVLDPSTRNFATWPNQPQALRRKNCFQNIESGVVKKGKGLRAGRDSFPKAIERKENLEQTLLVLFPGCGGVPHSVAIR